jgi:hypothetical protein
MTTWSGERGGKQSILVYVIFPETLPNFFYLFFFSSSGGLPAAHNTHSCESIVLWD